MGGVLGRRASILPESSASTAERLGGLRTARWACSWAMPATRVRHWWIVRCVFRRSGPKIVSVAARRGYRTRSSFRPSRKLARQMIGRALDAGVPVGWVAGDEVYGTASKVRRMLEARQVSYVLAVACNQHLWWPDFQQQRVDAIAQSLPKRAWKRLSAGSGSKGERLYDWALVRLSEQQGWARTLLVRRSRGEKLEHAFYLCYAPTPKSTLALLVRVAGQRWQIEQCFETAKGECGLDHYEVRHWQGWQRHITLAM